MREVVQALSCHSSCIKCASIDEACSSIPTVQWLAHGRGSRPWLGGASDLLSSQPRDNPSAGMPALGPMAGQRLGCERWRCAGVPDTMRGAQGRGITLCCVALHILRCWLRWPALFSNRIGRDRVVWSSGTVSMIVELPFRCWSLEPLTRSEFRSHVRHVMRRTI